MEHKLRKIRIVEFVLFSALLYAFSIFVILPIFVKDGEMQRFYRKITAAANDVTGYIFIDNNACPTGFTPAAVSAAYVLHHSSGSGSNATPVTISNEPSHNHGAHGAHSHTPPSRSVGRTAGEYTATTLTAAANHDHGSTGSHSHSYIPRYRNLNMCSFTIQ